MRISPFPDSAARPASPARPARAPVMTTGAFFDINRVNDTPAGTSLQLIQASGGNGTSIMICFSITDREDLNLSFVSGKSHPTSCDNGAWAWSTDRATFTTMASVNTLPATNANGITALRSVVFSGIPALNDARNVTLRYTLSRNAGAPSATRFITIDNLQLNADVILPCPADLTGNDVVNVSDLLALIANWGPCDAPCPPVRPRDPICAGDLDGDCVVNVTDLLDLIDEWGECP